VILVNSFDGYRAAWGPLAHSFEKYWPDHPSITFVTETLDPPIGNMTVKTGPCSCWADRMLVAMRVMGDVTLYMQEDYWLTHTIDTGRVMELAGYVRNGLADRIQLRAGWNHQVPDGPAGFDSSLLKLASSSPYRTSLQASLWSKGALSSLLHSGDSVWDFERKRNKDTRGMAVYGVKESVIHYPMFIVRGHWTKHARAYAEREGLDVDFTREPGE